MIARWGFTCRTVMKLVNYFEFLKMKICKQKFAKTEKHLDTAEKVGSVRHEDFFYAS